MPEFLSYNKLSKRFCGNICCKDKFFIGLNPSATSRVFTDHFTTVIFIFIFFVQPGLVVYGILKKYPNSTCKELYCTTEQRCACKEGQQKTL